MRRAELVLLILGLILITAGILLQESPKTIEKTITVPKEQLVLDTTLEVPPLKYVYKRFNVPPGAKEPKLYITINVLKGGKRDIELKVLNAAGQELYSEKLAGYAERTVKLPGPGTYEIRFDNGFSVVTKKTVDARVTLSYKESIVRTEQVQESKTPETLMQTGFALLVIGGVIAAVKTAKRSVQAFREGLRGR